MNEFISESCGRENQISVRIVKQTLPLVEILAWQDRKNSNIVEGLVSKRERV